MSSRSYGGDRNPWTFDSEDATAIPPLRRLSRCARQRAGYTDDRRRDRLDTPYLPYPL